MTLDLKIRNGRKGTIAELDGEIDSATSAGLLDRLLPLLDQSKGKTLVIDLGKVEYVSSAGLRTLLVVYREAQRSSAAVRLTGLSEELRFVMSVTGFLDFFEESETAPSRVLR
ncbi:STAS domain-containing protein [Streptacidiphilus rugosus]|uniref:STAS domain-containing protein n=1 Tax=Streptacidiphilus rugosus TaxID=405783 RepID=UPI00056AA35B|nr:STAS domain-containing protein [Streptacidiphilus rugosus]